MTRKVTLVFLASLIGVTAVVGIGAFFLNRYQVRRHLGAVLKRADRTEAEGDLDKTVFYLRRYLIDRPKDAAVWARLAGTLDRKIPVGPRRMQVYDAYTQAVLLNRDDPVVRRACAAVAMEKDLQRYADALSHLEFLYDQHRKPGPQRPRSRRARRPDGPVRGGPGQFRRGPEMVPQGHWARPRTNHSL